jgi:PIN domain
MSELKEAADRLASALADVDEEELAAEFKELRRRGKGASAEMIVLDANILIRAILGRRVRQLIDTYAGQGVRFFAPEVAFDDAEKYFCLPC